MVKKISIKGLNITFVFRHKWDTISKERFYDTMFKPYELGFWYRFNKIVGRNNFNKPNQWSKNLVGSHMLGINLLVAKFWIELNYKGMIL